MEKNIMKEININKLIELLKEEKNNLWLIECINGWVQYKTSIPKIVQFSHNYWKEKDANFLMRLEWIACKFDNGEMIGVYDLNKRLIKQNINLINSIKKNYLTDVYFIFKN
jgi:hypothetical protein